MPPKTAIVVDCASVARWTHERSAYLILLQEYAFCIHACGTVFDWMFVEQAPLIGHAMSPGSCNFMASPPVGHREVPAGGLAASEVDSDGSHTCASTPKQDYTFTVRPCLLMDSPVASVVGVA